MAVCVGLYLQNSNNSFLKVLQVVAPYMGVSENSGSSPQIINFDRLRFFL